MPEIPAAPKRRIPFLINSFSAEAHVLALDYSSLGHTHQREGGSSSASCFFIGKTIEFLTVLEHINKMLGHLLSPNFCLP